MPITAQPSLAAIPGRARLSAPGLVWQSLRAWSALYRQRRQLGALDDHLLADIGVTREQAMREARRRFWDAPAHWQG